MIDNQEITATLTKLYQLFDEATKSNTTDTYLLKLYSKFALMEFCGWIEESMDEIVDCFAIRTLSNQTYKDIFRQTIKVNNYGFKWKENFRPMLFKTIGIHNLEKIDLILQDRGIIIDSLHGELTGLSAERGIAAHTFINSQFKTPSIYLNTLNIIYPILKEIEREIDLIT